MVAIQRLTANCKGKWNGRRKMKWRPSFSQDFLKKVFEKFRLHRWGSSFFFCACLTGSLRSRPHAQFKCGMQWNLNHYVKIHSISFLFLILFKLSQFRIINIRWNFLDGLIKLWINHGRFCIPKSWLKQYKII